ncbi:helix-turn-helix domain-containing protein [Agromyces sp. MMS24-JH15]|uniref:helix-turn-helix domain-containing protein n=1 Tax=Agromyces sp. MMS24-JH15 TaxID=3243765 RepID=UPI00374A5D38
MSDAELHTAGTPEASAARIGRALRSRRRELRVTQEELAELAGVSTRFIGALEGGKPTARLDHVAAVALALGVDLGITTTW